MDVIEERMFLRDFCNGRRCSQCPLGGSACRCGWGTHFMHKDDNGVFEMSDEEIKKAYVIAIGAKLPDIFELLV